MSTATLIEIEYRLKGMSETDQERVLALVRQIPTAERPHGISRTELIALVDSLPPLSEAAAREMEEAIEEGCERVDSDE